MKSMKLVAAVAILVVATAISAGADIIDLTFEGVAATYPSGYPQVLNFYNGGTSSDGMTGPNYGISFPDNALAICLNTPGNYCSNTSRGGLGDPNSQKGALFFLEGGSTFLDIAAGFTTGFSFNYVAINTGGSINVWSGLDGTGSLLATLDLTTTSSACDFAIYEAGFCPFFPIGVAFGGTAQSIEFVGVANQIVFDDVTFGSVTPGVPEPSTLLLFGTGLVGAAGAIRRKLSL